MNIFEKILTFLVLLKYVQNNDFEQLCLDGTDWNEFKTDFNINFYNSSLEMTA